MSDDILDKGVGFATSRQVGNYHQRTARGRFACYTAYKDRTSRIEDETLKNDRCHFERTRLIVRVEMTVQFLKSLQIARCRISNYKLVHVSVVPQCAVAANCILYNFSRPALRGLFLLSVSRLRLPFAVKAGKMRTPLSSRLVQGNGPCVDKNADI